MIAVPLSKPASVDGVEIAEIKMDPARMNGRGIIAAERAAVADNGHVPLADRRFDAGFLAQLATYAAKLPPDVVLDLPARDFDAVTGAVRDFLLSTD